VLAALRQIIPLWEGLNLSKTSVATESIYGFAPVAEQASVSPSEEESIFVLSATQLQDIVSRAIQEAIVPLYQEIAYDRQRIAKLEQKEPQPLQRDRGEILRALLVANNGKLLAKQARQKMRVPKSSFSELLKTCDFIEIRPYHMDKRQDLLVLK
jgi:hypothetical protein